MIVSAHIDCFWLGSPRGRGLLTPCSLISFGALCPSFSKTMAAVRESNRLNSKRRQMLLFNSIHRRTHGALYSSGTTASETRVKGTVQWQVFMPFHPCPFCLLALFMQTANQDHSLPMNSFDSFDALSADHFSLISSSLSRFTCSLKDKCAHIVCSGFSFWLPSSFQPTRIY